MVFLGRRINKRFPTMASFTDNTFSLDSTLGDLPSIQSQIDYQTAGEQVLKLFHENQKNPGVIVMQNSSIIGLISREAFFETTGKRYGVELFLGRPISAMLEQFSTQPLILPEDFKISLAIHEALKRTARSVYDPIIVNKTNGKFGVIDILTVFLAENQILLTLHNQHVDSKASGLALSDEEAVKRFLKFTGIRMIKDPLVLINTNSIVCDRCGITINYTIADIVRSHPQLSMGVEIIEKMGNRSFILYVRHTCGQEIREIPVYHDNELLLRSLRPSRLVETYV
jgi:hypothetical protein